MKNATVANVITKICPSFGCKRASKQTGVILNDQMDDFSSPGVVNSYGLRPSEANFIVPG